ncbi:MAG: Nramp family divalent metal transporter [Flavobacteriaceae bacterium]|nr:Nramp family divalent metal transporter [Flavobacteriaceae bacterium]
MRKYLKNIGPGSVIAAAFIGPGTVTMCTIAGSKFGFTLLWALLLSIVITIFLQIIAVRIGIISQSSLSNAIVSQFKSKTIRTVSIILILSAILVGNIAYEAGNISGGVLGLEAVFGNLDIAGGYNAYSLIIGFIAFIILLLGNNRLLEKILMGLVLFMSLAFLFTAIKIKPDLNSFFSGLFIPSFPDDSILIIIGLIGTTVVPYNLFLHVSLAKEKWTSPKDLKDARIDTIVAVLVGGLISICIIISATSIGLDQLNSAIDLAKGLEPVFGNFSKQLISFGLFAAGLTSAITAPLAAAYVTCGCLNWSTELKSLRFRMVWFIVLIVGVVCSSLNVSSIEIIKFAQVANGILLPTITFFLILIANNNNVLGKYVNNWKHNLVSCFILLITLILGIKSIIKVFDII